jgi:hypothetical protein
VYKQGLFLLTLLIELQIDKESSLEFEKLLYWHSHDPGQDFERRAMALIVSGLLALKRYTSTAKIS